MSDCSLQVQSFSYAGLHRILRFSQSKALLKALTDTALMLAM